MRTFGLVGYPLEHSFSQKYFSDKFSREGIADCEFKNFPIQDISELPYLIKSNPALCGLSVTLPHKQSVIKYLHGIDKTAGEAGAVNCIKIMKQESVLRMEGYNTDVFGFEHSLKLLLKPHHTKALILGSGGSAKAVSYFLDKSKIKFRYVLRNKNKTHGSKDFLSYHEINREIILECPLIINATPVGMFPHVEDYPKIPYEYLTSEHLLYDLIYNPEETQFLKKGRERGVQIKNGLEMLQLQADKAWEIWNSSY